MATRRSYHPHPPLAATSTGMPVGDGVAASIADHEGIVITTISRRLDVAADEADAADLMAVVAVCGDIDLDTAPVLQQALISAIDDRLRTVLDLHDAGFFGAAGVHVLLAAHRHAAGHRRFFALRGVHGIADRVLRIVGLNHVIPRVG
jgi:anti-anti-sigma factor